MTIHCRICDRAIRSDKLNAQEDVLVQMTTHLQIHQEQAIRLRESLLSATRLMATYMLISLYVRVEPEEKEFLETFRQNEEELLSIFALEPATEQTQEN